MNGATVRLHQALCDGQFQSASARTAAQLLEGFKDTLVRIFGDPGPAVK